MDFNGEIRSEISYCSETCLILAILGLASECLAYWIPGYPEIVIVGVLIFQPVAVVLGLIGRRQRGEARSVAHWGLGLSVISMFGFCLVPLSRFESGATRAFVLETRLKRIGVALSKYHSEHGEFPPAVVRDRNGRPLYSWRVLLLPYLGESELYNTFHLDEPWDSSHNRSLQRQCPLAFRPIDLGAGRGATFIQAFVGTGTAFEGPNGQSYLQADGSSNFPDGESRTILVVESAESVMWTAPEDIPFIVTGPAPPLGGGYNRDLEPFNHREDGRRFHAVFVDGSVKSFRLPISMVELNALVTRNGGEPIPEAER